MDQMQCAKTCLEAMNVSVQKATVATPLVGVKDAAKALVPANHLLSWLATSASLLVALPTVIARIRPNVSRSQVESATVLALQATKIAQMVAALMSMNAKMGWDHPVAGEPLALTKKDPSPVLAQVEPLEMLTMETARL